MDDLTDSRIERLKEVAHNRQRDLTVILENVHNPHNIGAILRTCDSVGIHEIFIVYTDNRLSEGKNIEPGKTSSTGANKWVNIHYFENVRTCFDAVRKNYKRILGTALADDAEELYELDLKESTALLFGNESDGLSSLARELSDGNFLIPQVGFVKSLNISVACAVTIYEAFRQRQEDSNEEAKYSKWHDQLFNRYKEIHLETKIEKREKKLQKKLRKATK